MSECFKCERHKKQAEHFRESMRRAWQESEMKAVSQYTKGYREALLDVRKKVKSLSYSDFLEYIDRAEKRPRKIKEKL